MCYLDSGLRQVDLECHFLPHEDVWVACFGKKSLQDVQLRTRESRALPTLFAWGAYKKYYYYYYYYCHVKIYVEFIPEEFRRKIIGPWKAMYQRWCAFITFKK